MIYLAAFSIALVMVYLKSSQQLNVVHLKWAHVPPYSYGLAFTEYFLMGYAGVFIVNGDWTGFLVYGLAGGTGGWIGCFFGMYQHKRWADHRDIERVGL